MSCRYLSIIALILFVGGCDAGFESLRDSRAPGESSDANDTDARLDAGPEDVADIDVGDGGELHDVGDDDADSSEPGDINGVTTLAAGTLETLRYGAMGTVTIERRADGDYLLLGGDFSLGSIPDPTVFVTRESESISADGDAAGEFFIANLESFSGAQEYRLPFSFDIDAHRFVWVHCFAFDLEAGRAMLEANP